MKLLRGALVKTSSATALAYGTLSEATTLLLRYQATIAVSPWPVTATWPTSSMSATVVLFEVNLAQRVTSSL